MIMSGITGADTTSTRGITMIGPSKIALRRPIRGPDCTKGNNFAQRYPPPSFPSSRRRTAGRSATARGIFPDIHILASP